MRILGSHTHLYLSSASSTTRRLVLLCSCTALTLSDPGCASKKACSLACTCSHTCDNDWVTVALLMLPLLLRVIPGMGSGITVSRLLWRSHVRWNKVCDDIRALEDRNARNEETSIRV